MEWYKIRYQMVVSSIEIMNMVFRVLFFGEFGFLQANSICKTCKQSVNGSLNSISDHEVQFLINSSNLKRNTEKRKKNNFQCFLCWKVFKETSYICPLSEIVSSHLEMMEWKIGIAWWKPFLMWNEWQPDYWLNYWNVIAQRLFANV